MVITALALSGGSAAHGTAQVGETLQVEAKPVPVPALAQLRAEYRRPDTIPFPASNPYTPAKAMLGRLLFDDPRLSDSGSIACASCHNPGLSYGDGLSRSVGRNMKSLDRRSPSIINSAWGGLFMWDGRAASLEQQALEPIDAPSEMNTTRDRLISTLTRISEYRTQFKVAFPRREITPEAVADAVATYERTVVSEMAPFDAWIDGDEGAISDSAKLGFELFNAKAKCAACHSGWRLTDNGFHDIGLPSEDIGRGRLLPTVITMQHAFKTPSLREVARRAPYMHDGSLPTLEAVVAHYDQGGVDRPSRSVLITPLGLSADEQTEIVAFLQTLTSTVRSGVPAALPQ